MTNIPKTEGLRSAEYKPYTFVPAAITYPSDGGLGIYIRYGKYPNKIVVKEEGYGYIWIQCPDRELVLVSSTNYAWKFRPMMGTFDEYVHLGPFDDHVNSDMNLPYMMVNYYAESAKQFSNARQGGKFVDPNTLTMSDSGGYQILQGRCEYLDPKLIIDWYNNNVDLGFVLDTPANRQASELLIRSAKVQARNTDIMMQGKAENVELINILHGANEYDMREYRNIVERPDVDRLAFGSLYHYYTLMKSIDLMYQVCHTGQEYKHVHVLGVANSLHVALLIRMATKGLVPHLTSDSSTPMQKARLREWHTYVATQEKVKYTLVGYKDGYRPSPNALLPCSCQVCSAVKYADVLWCLNGNIATKVFEFHNIHSMGRHFDILTEYSKEMTTREFKQVLKSQVGSNRQGFDEALHTLDYMDDLVGHGHSIAKNRFRAFLGADIDMEVSELGNNLFDASEYEAVSSPTIGVDGDEDDRVENVSSNSIEEILKRYEDTEAQSNLKHGKKLKTAIANTRSTKNVTGGTTRKALTASQAKKKRLENH